MAAAFPQRCEVVRLAAMAASRERYSLSTVASDHAALPVLWGEPPDPGAEALAIHRDGDLIGLVGLEPAGARMQATWATGGPPADVLGGLVQLTTAHPRERFEVLIGGEPARDLDRALDDAGFALLLDQLHLRGPLTSAPAPPSSPFTYRPVTPASRRALLWLIARVWPYGTPLDVSPAEELAAIEHASAGPDGAPDRSLWRFADHAGATAGLVLAHRHADDPHVGSLAAFGLVPELRGRGLGAALHDDALALLHQAGASTYHESTPATNAPMLTLLHRAGCTLAGRTKVYVLNRRPAGYFLRGST
jgi:GNAT superfamily N-acetyltransferase